MLFGLKFRSHVFSAINDFGIREFVLLGSGPTIEKWWSSYGVAWPLPVPASGLVLACLGIVCSPLGVANRHFIPGLLHRFPYGEFARVPETPLRRDENLL